MGQQMICKLVAASAMFLVLAATFWTMCVEAWSTSTLMTLLHFGISLLMSVCCLACLDICRRDPADSFTLRQLALQYAVQTAIITFSFFSYRKMRAKLIDCKKAQARTLDELLRENQDTAFGRDHGLFSIRDRQQFVEKLEISDYSVYEQYAERIAKGEKNVMTKAEVVILALSSGTTGKNKMYPYTKARYGALSGAMLAAVYRNRHYSNSMKRIFQFRLFHPASTNEAGMKMGGIGSVLDNMMNYNIVPLDFLKLSKEGPSFYVQAVFALAEPELGKIEGFSPDLLYSLFQLIMRHRESLCDALSDGVIAPFPGLDENIRWSLNKRMKANTKRAEEVRTILSSGSKVGLARLLWPDLSLVLMASGGGFAHSAALLRSSYLKGIPTGFSAHMATEGLIGATMDDDLVSEIYTMVPTMNFLEFIPVENMHDDNPPMLFMEQLEVDHMYEVVVTNVYGLYRNRFGDVIKVVGFCHGTPKYKFMYRAGQILTIAYDRTPEKAIFEAVKKAESSWENVTVVDYTAAESFHVEPVMGGEFEQGCYVIFMEIAAIAGEDTAPKLTQEHANQLDDILCDVHETYKDYRLQESVGRLRIIQVSQGTFQKVKQILTNDKVSTQFKMPRVIRKREALTFFWQNSV